MYDFPSMKSMHFEIDDTDSNYMLLFTDFLRHWLFYGPASVTRVSFETERPHAVCNNVYYDEEGDDIAGEAAEIAPMSAALQKLVNELNLRLRVEGVARPVRQRHTWVWQAAGNSVLRWQQRVWQ